ncbi:MAG TPA: hypothetical protein VJN18_11470 [Polyangiaceae bacterium]|nr:hypothetical protein [Polyangiaceae bacterium]
MVQNQLPSVAIQTSVMGRAPSVDLDLLADAAVLGSLDQIEIAVARLQDAVYRKLYPELMSIAGYWFRALPRAAELMEDTLHEFMAVKFRHIVGKWTPADGHFVPFLLRCFSNECRSQRRHLWRRALLLREANQGGALRISGTTGERGVIVPLKPATGDAVRHAAGLIERLCPRLDTDLRSRLAGALGAFEDLARTLDDTAREHGIFLPEEWETLLFVLLVVEDGSRALGEVESSSGKLLARCFDRACRRPGLTALEMLTLLGKELLELPPRELSRRVLLLDLQRVEPLPLPLTAQLEEEAELAAQAVAHRLLDLQGLNPEELVEVKEKGRSRRIMRRVLLLENTDNRLKQRLCQAMKKLARTNAELVKESA